MIQKKKKKKKKRKDSESPGHIAHGCYDFLKSFFPHITSRLSRDNIAFRSKLNDTNTSFKLTLNENL